MPRSAPCVLRASERNCSALHGVPFCTERGHFGVEPRDGGMATGRLLNVFVSTSRCSLVLPLGMPRPLVAQLGHLQQRVSKIVAL